MSLLSEYRKFRRTTIQYKPHMVLPYLTAGLAGEAGEVCGKISKIFREDPKKPTDEDIALELGDVVYMVDALAEYFGYTLEEIIKMNQSKLEKRLERNTIKGSGDTR